MIALEFLSTPSARRATVYKYLRRKYEMISIHALCEEGDGIELRVGQDVDISIHALCEEGDGSRASGGKMGKNFYPRPLRGGRLQRFEQVRGTGGISIHALCEEGDPLLFILLYIIRHFYPRPLRGGRLAGRVLKVDSERFLSTPSARRATAQIERVLHFLDTFLSTPSARRATLLLIF